MREKINLLPIKLTLSNQIKSNLLVVVPAKRALERAHRRCPANVSLATWKYQFSIQRRLFHQKATDYWSRTIAECAGDPRQLWSKLNKLLEQPTVSQFRHTESDFAKHFAKVNTIRTATAIAIIVLTPQDIRNRPSSSLSEFQPVTTNEILRLIRKAPCKHCPLDPMPTWLVNRAADVLAPVITNVCNASLQTGHFPDSQKQARVTARLKKASPRKRSPDGASSPDLSCGHLIAA